MDGHPNKKTKKYLNIDYSETRYAVIKWLEKELPLVHGNILIVSAGNWDIPKKILSKNKNINTIKTFDRDKYGSTKNVVDFVGDVHNMPKDWDNKWDCIINNQAIECYENPFKAMDEMFRVIKNTGVLLIDAPFNYRFFGKGSWEDKKQNEKNVQDYWRITENGWQLLTKKFKDVNIEGFGGSGKHDRYVYCIRAVK